MPYLLHIIILIAIYIIIAVSLNLIAGYTGILTVAHSAFYGIGAYIAALMAVHLDLPFSVNLLCVIFITAAIALLIAIPALRIHDDYLIIVTFGFQMIIFSVFNNWISLTGGSLGIPGIPYIEVFGLTVDSHVEYLILVGFISYAIYFIVNRLVESPFGRVLKAIREDEIFVVSLGKNVAMFKIIVFVIGGSLAAVAGFLYAHYVTFIDPTSFTILESIFMISIVIIGGAGRLAGSIIGAVLLIVIPELLRFIGLPNSIEANMRQIIYGGLLILFLMFRPQGLVGEYRFK